MAEHTFNNLLPFIEHFHSLGYWIAFLAAFLETALVVGLLLPGSTLLLLLGALSAHGPLDFGAVLGFAVAGAILGDNLNYWLGRRYGRRWTDNGIGFLTPEHFQQTRRFLDQHGSKSVFLGRFVPSIKEIAPFIAGSVGMRQPVFLFWNALGGIGWGLQWVGGGYLFGQSLKLAQAWMSRAGMAVFALVALGLLLWLLKWGVQRHGPAVWRLLVSLSRSVFAAIRDNPFVRRFSRRHPRLIGFVARRGDPSHFCGLPLSLLILAFGYVLALFVGVVEDLISSDPIVALDHATAQLVAAFRAPELIAPVIRVTELGSARAIGPLLLVAAAMLWLFQRRWLIAPLLVSSIGASAFTLLGKLAFHRPRPAEAILFESSWSFPSGHATIAVACYGFLGYLWVRSSDDWRARVNRFFLVAVLILLIGLSRILLGVHYLSDVWAGYLVGTLWLIIAISLSEWLTATGRVDWRSRVTPGRRRAALALGMVALAGYLGFAAQWQPALRQPAPPTAMLISQPINQLLREQGLTRTETLLGAPSQPLGFAIIADDADTLLATLEAAGWHPADAPGLHTLSRLMREGMDYHHAPLAPAFWNRHINDLALERPVQAAGGPAIATLRLWQTAYRTERGRVFVGVVRDYTGIRWGLLHRVAADVDAATEQFVDSLRQSQPTRVQTAQQAPARGQTGCLRPLTDPVIGDYLLGGRYFTRGGLWLIDLTGPSPGQPSLACRAESGKG